MLSSEDNWGGTDGGREPANVVGSITFEEGSTRVIPEAEEIRAMHDHGPDVRGMLTVSFWILGGLACLAIAYWEWTAMRSNGGMVDGGA